MMGGTAGDSFCFAAVRSDGCLIPRIDKMKHIRRAVLIRAGRQL